MTAHSAHLALACLLLLAPGCRRLNPEWCASGARCAPGEVCDPATNTCLPRDAGAREARVADLTDGPGAERRADLPEDRGVEPDRTRDSTVESCASASGGWVCSGGAAYECSETSPLKRRLCPLGECKSGHCQLSSASGCKRNQDCPTGKLCTLFRDKADIKSLCAVPVIGLPAPAPCKNGLDCASGLCTSSGQCYYACDVGSDCPPSHTCKAISVLVEGITAPAKSCELP
jgi:hypothetical protein